MATAPPTSAGGLLLLPVVPHVGETDTDTLAEIPGRSAEAEEEEEEEDEFGYSWSEFTFFTFACCSAFPPLEGDKAACVGRPEARGQIEEGDSSSRGADG